MNCFELLPWLKREQNVSIISTFIALERSFKVFQKMQLLLCSLNLQFKSYSSSMTSVWYLTITLRTKGLKILRVKENSILKKCNLFRNRQEKQIPLQYNVEEFISELITQHHQKRKCRKSALISQKNQIKTWSWTCNTEEGIFKRYFLWHPFLRTSCT